ncbi:MAG: DNA-directed RNA polymerases I and III subunit RPAC1 [Thelocarpon superellum]|nr:MAG: DNA-directed RNA polymerases I and III subunit RPAC1 [Thelocarpon superellum]
MGVQASPEALEERRMVGVNAETVTNVTSTDFPGHYPGEDHAWSLAKFKKNFHVQFHDASDPLDCSFSLIGIDASIANAFRRILLAEIPTLAIEYVFVHINTSIVQDEVLSHRLGLVPLKGNKDGLNWMKWFKKPTEDDPEGSAPTDINTVILRLEVDCTYNAEAKKGETDPLKLYHNAHVYASSLTFHPAGRQTEFFTGPGKEICPVNPSILLAKLRPEQKIHLEMHCIKGIGADHAKFSPVATASYRLLPTITITQPILGKDADKFARCFPKGVIALETVTRDEAAMSGSAYEGQEGVKKAVVRDTLRDTVSRECLRHEEFRGKVQLGRVRDHFIFSIESTGQFDSDELFIESVKVLKVKCERLKRSLVNMVR